MFKALLRCLQLQLETHRSKAYLSTADGRLHPAATLYLNERYRNPHTKETAARPLRFLVRLCDAFDIDIASRALQARCLTQAEVRALRQLVFLPIARVHSTSDEGVRTVASAVKELSRREKTVQRGTAAKRLIQIADFLLWFHRKVLEPRMPLGSATTTALRREYEACADELRTAVGAPKTSHPHLIRSVTNDRFLKIYTALLLKPEEFLKTRNGNTGKHVLRDRAIILLAGEGIRPGAIGNVALADFSWPGGNKPGYIAIRDNVSRRTRPVTTATPVQKGVNSFQNYNSEITVSIWPTTALAIRQYIDSERYAVISRTLRNRTNGFLFVADHGGPIGDRGTIAEVFRRAGQGLKASGLLTKDPSDPYLQSEAYSFNAYLLRHSAASLFYSQKAQTMCSEVVTDLMKMRFGWGINSNMPSLYARRAMSDTASLTVEDYMDSLFSDAAKHKNSRGTAQ